MNPTKNSTEFSLNGLKLSNEFRDIIVRLGIIVPGFFDSVELHKSYVAAGGKYQY